MLKVVSPYDQKTIKELPLSSPSEVESALAKAHALFSNRENWIPAHRRIHILKKVIELMTERKDALIKTAAEEGGKPWIDSQVEVERAINGAEIAISEISNLRGEQIAMGHTASSSHRWAFTVREPVGVVVAISAFNHPLNLIIHQSVTAIAAGAPVIVKPALTTPLSCLAFIEILKEAGLPDGWCQCLICDNPLAEIMATDMRVSYLSFIGSSRVGWDLKSKLAPGVACALEHGGAAPVIVEPDADIDALVPLLVKAGFYHAGQVCVSAQRVFVHKKIFDEVSDKMKGLTEKLILGNPLDKKTEVGPLILPQEVERVENWVNEATEQGAKQICGGKRISETCFQPTLLENPDENSQVSQSEIFGPVICLYSYKNSEEAIHKANSLPFIFQAAVFTRNIDIALETANKLNATAVMINDHTAFRVDWMPFGGRGESGIGRGGIPYSIQEMTAEKLIVIKSKGI